MRLHEIAGAQGSTAATAATPSTASAVDHQITRSGIIIGHRRVRAPWSALLGYARLVGLGPRTQTLCAWRVELTPTRIPVVYTYLLDSASRRYRDGDVYIGLVKATAPFQVEIDLSVLA